MFNFFQNTTIESTKSIVRDYHYLIKSINFPAESIIVSIVLRNFFSHLFELSLVVVLFLFFNISLFHIFFYLPALILLIIFTLGSSLILSSLTVYFMDLDNIWNFITRIIWLGTPIFYAIGGQEKLFLVNLFNPIYYLITLARETIMYGRPPEYWVIFGALASSFLVFLLGLFIFNKLKSRFSEMI